MSCELKVIDGSMLEGGGQILRIALTLSVIRKIPIRLIKIRAGRSKPGLMEQHLKGIELLRDLCNAKVKGASLGSTEVEFWPGELTGGNHEARVKTAGSISLLLQAALPCCLFAKTHTTLRLHGGTNAEMAPQIDYTTEVFRPILEKFGATFNFDLLRRGYFPKGGGEVIINIDPVIKLDSVNLTERGQLVSIYGWSFVAGTLPVNMSHLMADSATHCLKRFCNNIKIERYKELRNVAPDNCSGIILVAETDTGCVLGGSALGKRGESAEETGKRAAVELVKSIEEGACVDGHSQDQIIVFMALAQGASSVKVGEITMHTKTAIFVAEELTDTRFEIVQKGPANIINCTPQPVT
ncbi:RNA 3'-terminal phosphate cyclase [Tribolium castaneum]|uniref:RNA 3'-terminal phosphate cyclase n=1 Tax=Tribolium castaneum TaxID=7070 RepID=D6WSP1_TRICA|nr:PREDICTED: RNA 3'-terminal phosphate cyclase [Tribolium castaneum]EFA07135.2 RNA 3'-terminal phosphate cyclase-like Protein [Tribolium castaneum]|eukprot:XP_008196316.1 PREDICTED: RNA 3'-terminal phosphate cyclase [Tribolium castaneum]